MNKYVQSRPWTEPCSYQPILARVVARLHLGNVRRRLLGCLFKQPVSRGSTKIS